MKVAIIGAGNVGKALGSSIGKAGHEVVFASTGDSAEAAAKQMGATTASPRDAAAQSEIVILAVPYTATRDVISEIGDGASGKLVVDVTNPLRPDMSGLATEPGTSAAEQIARWTPDATVAKAFNTMFASVMGNPNVHGERLDALFATDDDDAREKLAGLIDSMGFRPIYVGGLARARGLEAMGFLNIALQATMGGSWNTAYKLVAPPAAALEHRTKASANTKQ